MTHKYVWVPSQTESWLAGCIISSDSDKITCKLPDGTTAQFPGDISKYDNIDPETLEEDFGNLVDLDVFNEGIILHQIKKRFAIDTIYTFVGSILIAVNPYRSVDIYGESRMEACYNAIISNSTPVPHIYSIAGLAVFSMRNDKKDQAVLISGESGAGKTEATKKVLQFISAMSSSTASRAGLSVEAQILDSNPLLESFGNAKTLRNNNSSRFGKYMQVNFTKHNSIKGCSIVAYLLEKSRVVRQTTGERNYHVFYMLLEGASVKMRQEFELKPPEQFYYLSQSGCITVPNRNDVKEFKDMVQAMTNLSMNEEAQHELFQCLAGILHLGNIEFVAASQGTDSGCVVKNKPDLRRAGALLGCNPETLEQSLCFTERTVGGESIYSPIDPAKAIDLRDALAKFVYGKLFDVLVSKLNNTLFRGMPGNNIGILDIFGFEVFKVNSFEQLCINYCNERLQTFFNEVIFEGEMKAYEAESISCDGITFMDNKGCVRLIDMRGASIFVYLDEEINVPKGSDDKLISKLHNVFDESTATKSAYYGRNRKAPKTFNVRHFAGEVTYTIDNFLEKNKDALAPALLKQMDTSSVPMLAGVITDVLADHNAVSPPPKGGKKGKLTLCGKFKIELDSLMNTLRQTSPHFIRCTKPNDLQKPKIFDCPTVLNQLRYSGLFEAINIRKAGFGIRLTHDNFIARFSVCVPLSIGGSRKIKNSNNTPPSSSATKTPAGLCATLLEYLGKEVKCSNVVGKPAEWAVGLTRVFIRNQSFKNKIEIYRTDVSNSVVICMQAMARGGTVRLRVAREKIEAYKAQCASMGIEPVEISAATLNGDKAKEKKEREIMAEEDLYSYECENLFRNDTELQSSIKRDREAKRQEKLRAGKLLIMSSCIKIQAQFRGWVGQIIGRIYMLEKSIEKAILNRDEGSLERSIRFTTGFLHTCAVSQAKRTKLKPKDGHSNTGYTCGKHSKLLMTYLKNAKEVLLEVQGECYMTNQLVQAIRSQCMELLDEAIDMAEHLHMSYLKELKEAKQLREELLHRRTVLDQLSNELSRCTSVPKLLSHCDKLEKMIMQATRLGLGGEYHVHDAVMRLGKISNLIKIRDDIRFSIEICSLEKMKSGMEARNKMVPIFGEELCAEEALAVDGMRRMFRYQDQLQESRRNARKAWKAAKEAASLASETPEAGADGEAAPAVIPCPLGEDPGESEDEEEEALDSSGPVLTEARLPIFIRTVLEEMRDSRTPEELEESIDKLVLLAPDTKKRKAFVTAFKWVVAFASWRYVRTPQEEAAQQAQQKILAETLNSPTSAYLRESAVTNKSNTKPKTKLQVLTSPGMSFGSPMHQSKHAKNVFSPNGRNGGASSASTPPLRDRFQVPCTISNDDRSPRSPMKTGPFSQRQSKSQVAAHEAIRKGKLVSGRTQIPSGHTGHADEMLKQILTNNDKFWVQNRKKHAWF